jgi:uncharacterized membrane protein
MKYVKELIVLLVFLGVLFSGWMAWTNHLHGDSVFCSLGGSCDLVQKSEYGELFGVLKVTTFGFIAYIVFFILAVSAFFYGRYYELFSIASIIGAGFALYFMYLQAFVLNAYCSNCLIIDGLTILIFLVNGGYWLKRRKVK